MERFMSMSTSLAPVRAPALTGVNLQPYLIGAGIGVLSWIVFLVVNTPIGITTSLAQVSAIPAASILGWDWVAKNSYWASQLPKLDYGTLFLAGTFLGGLLSALLARSWRVETVPEVWAERFGPSPAKRYAFAFLGGVIAMYGARMANGCTSGNGISGGLQLAVSGWVFLVAMFATGIATAMTMFRPAR
jgi:uncharacterized membrane protein YedE/YeeE